MVCESPTEAKVVNLPGPDSLHTVSEVEELFNSIMEVKNNNSKENLSKMDNDSPTTPTTITSTPPPTAAAAAAAASGEKANTQDLNASKLMHVSWKNTCPRSQEHQTRSSCKDCRPLSVSTNPNLAELLCIYGHR